MRIFLKCSCFIPDFDHECVQFFHDYDLGRQEIIYHQISNIICTLVAKKCWSHRCSWSSADRHCYNYIFILDFTPGFNGLGKDNCKTRRETFKFWDSVQLILDIWQYMMIFCHGNVLHNVGPLCREFTSDWWIPLMRGGPLGPVSI